ncbi:MAG TPA: hypothetical protein VFH61_02155 [Thermoleophilia bacterium]|nr:hypothetical protein [Thermoleophilia bacterium]
MTLAEILMLAGLATEAIERIAAVIGQAALDRPISQDERDAIRARMTQAERDWADA